MNFIKFLKENQHVLKKFNRENKAITKYSRERWMMRSNPSVDEGEEGLRVEIENF